MALLDEWFRRKVANLRTVREAREVRYVHASQVPGPGSYYASIRLRVEPATEFGFEWNATLLKNTDDDAVAAYRLAVLDGVLDELAVPSVEMNGGRRDFRSPITRVRVTVFDVALHPVDSSPWAFYCAARGAIRDSLQREGGGSNIG